jgi:integrase
MNDIDIKLKNLTIGLPKERKYAEDRAPTIEEIQKLIEYPDRRIRAIILTMISSGIRLGVWDDLYLKNITQLKKEMETL